MGWLPLAGAIAAEVVATSALKASVQFTRFWPSVVVVAGYGAAFVLLARAVQSVPLGVAYAVWSGVGLVLVTGVGRVLYGQRLDAAALLGMGLIVAGVLVIQLGSAAGR